MDVGAWLDGLGLGGYAQAFADNHVDAATLALLTEADLAALGLFSVGHRRRLAAAIDALRRTAAAAVPAGATDGQRDAEHRQITVLCCDMVGSTALSMRLDPERYRDVIRSFHGRCLHSIAAFDGWLANFIGDCALVYFGWPVAHEDDAERAVRAAMDLMQAVKGSGVRARAGIATGSAVVGDLVRDGPAREHSAVGPIPDRAARLQALAAPGHIVIDDLTRRLSPAFPTRPLAPRDSDGSLDADGAYLVSGERATDSRFDARTRGDATRMFGREQELLLLQDRWDQARQGEGTAVLVEGEAGIGKSRLVHALLDACAGQAQQVRWQCSPFHTTSALWPVIQHRSQALHGEEVVDAVPGATNGALDGPAPAPLTPQMLRERTLELLIERVCELAGRQPMLLVVEDLHWIDPTTAELIGRCLERLHSARLSIVMTTRADGAFAFPGHPRVTRLSLKRLKRADVETMAERLADGRLTPPTLSRIVAQTDGVPLFVEELVKAVVESGEATIPESLKGSLMARLDRIPEVKEVARVAACIGREFDLELLKAVCEEPETAQRGVDRLMAAELVFQRGDRTKPSFKFKHALLQEVVSESLLMKTRRAIHARILDVLENRHPPTPREVLAQHATVAGLVERAIAHWSAAGKAAQGLSAYREAAAAFESAIALVHVRPGDPDLQALELDLQMRLGQCRMGVFGFGARASLDAFERANELLKADPGGRQARLPVQYGLWVWRHMNAELRDALALGLEMLAAEEVDGTPDSIQIACRLVATAYGYLGEFSRAQAFYDKAMPLVDSERCLELKTLADPRIATLYQYSLLRCLQGRGDHSRRLIEQARALCTTQTTALQHGYLMLFSAFRAAIERDEAGVSGECANLADLLSRHRMLPGFDGFIDVLSVAPNLEPGPPAAVRIARGLRGLEKLETFGWHLYRPFLMARMATELSCCQRHDEASRLIDAAGVLCEATGQGWCDAEIWRVRGVLALQAPQADERRAAHCFTMASNLSRHRGAKVWELRATLDLARLHVLRERPLEAMTALAPVVGWFPERADSTDLAEARRLLGELRHANAQALGAELAGPEPPDTVGSLERR